LLLDVQQPKPSQPDQAFIAPVMLVKEARSITFFAYA
jgi:hypothetical protein